MWLVSTLLSDHWFNSLEEAIECWRASPRSRTYPYLDGGWPVSADAFQTVKFG
jgi:hypothetical protein